MPNLRKRSSILTYNDDAIYKAIENEKRSNENRRTSPQQNTSSAPDNIPEFVYADDGRQFLPCHFCCYAFAHKQQQLTHMEECNFKVAKKFVLPQSLSKIVSKPVTPNIYAKKYRPNPKLIDLKSNQSMVKPKIYKRTANMQMRKSELVQNHSKLIHKPQFVSVNKSVQLPKKLIQKANFPKIKFDSSSFNEDFKLTRLIKQEVISNDSSANLVPNRQQDKVLVAADKLKEYDELYKQSNMSKCTICFKPVTKIRWFRHLQTHAEIKSFLCIVCNRGFGRKDHLQLHEKTHLKAIGSS